MDQILPLLFMGALVGVIIWLFWGRESQANLKHEGRCLNCGYDLRYSKDRCPECGSTIPIRSGDYFPLRDDWPATPIDPRQPEGDELPVKVRRAANSMEASLMREQLIARGVACWVEQHQAVRLVGYQDRAIGDINVMVWSADEALAGDLLDHLTKPRSPAETRT